MNSPYLFLFWFQQAAETVSESLIKTLLLPFILVVLTAITTWFFARKKNEADISKIFAETIATYVKTINEIQETNQKLFEKIQLLRDENEKDGEEKQSLEAELERTKRELETCLKANMPCSEIDEILADAVLTLQKFETYLQNDNESTPLLNELKTLSEKIAKTKHR